MNDNTTMPKPAPAGNDMSDGDAREEGRMDKDEDLKTGEDSGSPLAKPFEDNENDSPKPGNIHADGNKAEADEPDPTDQDAPELTVTP